MAKKETQQSLLTVVDGSLEKIDNTIAIIDESKALNETLKASNAKLTQEEKASILETFINASSNVRVVAKKDGSRVIAWNGMVGFNVASVQSGKSVWVIKAFDNDANVVFQAYGSRNTVKLGKLTADWVKRIAKVEA